MKKPETTFDLQQHLDGYLARQADDHAHINCRRLVVAWGTECVARHKNVTRFQNSQEEAAYIKMLLHAV